MIQLTSGLKNKTEQDIWIVTAINQSHKMRNNISLHKMLCVWFVRKILKINVVFDIYVRTVDKEKQINQVKPCNTSKYI